MTVHTIRLREPWEKGFLESGAVKLSRKFNSPTGIGAQSRVFLVVGNLELIAEVWLNGGQLELLTGVGSGHRWDITNLLQPRNEVGLVVGQSDETTDASGLEPLVRLEIEERWGECG